MAKKKKIKEPDPYASVQTIKIYLPIPVIPLCKMIQVPPEKIIRGLLLDLGSEINLSNGCSQQRATEYFLAQKYGQESFTEGQIRQMLAELGVIMGLHPPHDIKDHTAFDKWRELMPDYFKAWEIKWQAKKRQSLIISSK